MGEVNGPKSNIRSKTIDHQNDHFGHCPRGQGEPVMRSRERSQYDHYNRNSDRRNSSISELNLTTATTRESQFSSLSTNASGNVHVGRGRHRLKHRRVATRADQYSNDCVSLAAPVVPVSQSRSEGEPNSAFDNKAFASDGDVVDTHELQTQNNSQLQSDALTQTTISVISSQNISDTTLFNDQLINNNNDISNENNKSRNCLVNAQNESESTSKRQQYCSLSDNCHVIRARNSRSRSVVKHIGVFYSDLCDVIKAMRSGNNSNNNNNNINNNNNSSNTNTNITSQQSCVNTGISSQSNHRNNIISTPVLLQNEHLISTTVPVPPQPQPSNTSYPQQVSHQPVTCLQSSQASHLTSGNTTIRSPSQSQTRLNETQVHDLPDILNSHLPPPPYSTLPPPSIHLPPLSLPPLAPIRAPPPPPPPPPLPAGRPPLPSRRILHAPPGPLTHCSRPNYLRPSCAVSETETSASKTCLSCNGVSIRWFILLIAFIGLLCAIIGTILGALRTTGREHLTLALLMIGELLNLSII